MDLLVFFKHWVIPIVMRITAYFQPVGPNKVLFIYRYIILFYFIFLHANPNSSSLISFNAHLALWDGAVTHFTDKQTEAL